MNVLTEETVKRLEAGDPDAHHFVERDVARAAHERLLVEFRRKMGQERTVNDDWIEVVRSDGSREMVRAEETLNGMKQRIILILYDELYVTGEHSIEGRVEAADRIVKEILAPLRKESR